MLEEAWLSLTREDSWGQRLQLLKKYRLDSRNDFLALELEST